MGYPEVGIPGLLLSCVVGNPETKVQISGPSERSSFTRRKQLVNK